MDMMNRDRKSTLSVPASNDITPPIPRVKPTEPSKTETQASSIYNSLTSWAEQATENKLPGLSDITKAAKTVAEFVRVDPDSIASYVGLKEIKDMIDDQLKPKAEQNIFQQTLSKASDAVYNLSKNLIGESATNTISNFISGAASTVGSVFNYIGEAVGAIYAGIKSLFTSRSEQEETERKAREERELRENLKLLTQEQSSRINGNFNSRTEDQRLLFELRDEIVSYLNPNKDYLSPKRDYLSVNILDKVDQADGITNNQPELMKPEEQLKGSTKSTLGASKTA